jgi:Flp pilus assembly protein TadD
MTISGVPTSSSCLAERTCTYPETPGRKPGRFPFSPLTSFSLPASEIVMRGLPTFWLFASFTALASLAYWPAIGGSLVWDDHYLVKDSPFFKSPAVVGEAFKHPLYVFSSSTYFRPVQSASYFMDYALGGSSLWLHHLTNILLHSAAACLLFLVFRRTIERLGPGDEAPSQLRAGYWVAGIASFLWLLHPIHHAGVAYISGRADSLAAVFALGAWLFLESAGSQRSAFGKFALIFAAAALGLLALYSKEIAILWFLLYGVYASFFKSGVHRMQRLLPWAGMLCVVLLYAWHRSLVLADVPEGEPAVLALDFRLRLAIRALGDYGQLLLWPGRLHMERRVIPFEGSESGFLATPWLAVFGTAFIAAAAALAFTSGRLARVRQFGVTWFFLGFLPISNLFPLNAQVAEHWIYMPSAGILLALGACLGELRTPLWRIGFTAAILWGTAFGVRTFVQAHTWKDEQTFFAATQKAGGDSPRIRSNIATSRTRNGDLLGAEAVLRAAMADFPNASGLKFNLIHNLIRQQKPDEAQALIDELARDDARSHLPWTLEMMRAQVAVTSGDLDAAIDQVQRLVAAWPHRWDLVRLQSALLQRAGRDEAARAILHSYVAKNWWHDEAVRQLAALSEKAGDEEQAIEKFELLAKLDMRAAEPWERLAALHRRRGNLEAAATALVEARNRRQRQ